jgi:protoheme IX farnesyltransferase
MTRTKGRALVSGSISPKHALVFASILGPVGLAILIIFTTYVAASLALLGLVLYVVVYGYAKRKTVHGTLVGSLSGSIPPVVDYTAVTGHWDVAAWLLFIVFALWQMPHFYAIAIYRLNDYRAAGLPVLPASHGIKAAKLQILAYIVAFMAAVSLLTITGYTGRVFLIVMTALGLFWLVLGIRGYKATNNDAWARSMFKFSLVVVVGLYLTLSIDAAFR